MSDCESNILSDYLRLKFDEMERKIMSAVTDKIAAATASADAAIARVQGDVASLQAQIDELKANATTPDDLAAIDALQAKLDALDPVKPDTLPDEPPAE